MWDGDTLEKLLRARNCNTETFSDQEKLTIQTKADRKYVLNSVFNSTVFIQKCKSLTLNGCQDVKVIASRLPIIGLHLNRCSNISVQLGTGVSTGGVSTDCVSSSGYIDIDAGIDCAIDSGLVCTVDVISSTGIILNDTVISDEYVESRWELRALQEPC